MLGEGHQQHIKNAERQANKDVLKGVNLALVQYLDHEENKEGKSDGHYGVFGRSHGFLIIVQRQQQVGAKGRFGEFTFIRFINPILRITTIKFEHVQPDESVTFVELPSGTKEMFSLPCRSRERLKSTGASSHAEAFTGLDTPEGSRSGTFVPGFTS